MSYYLFRTSSRATFVGINEGQIQFCIRGYIENYDRAGVRHGLVVPSINQMSRVGSLVIPCSEESTPWSSPHQAKVLDDVLFEIYPDALPRIVAIALHYQTLWLQRGELYKLQSQPYTYWFLPRPIMDALQEYCQARVKQKKRRPGSGTKITPMQ